MLFYIATTIALFVQSTPPPGGSLHQQFGAKGDEIWATRLVIGYFNILSDVYILLLPIFGVISLQLPRRRKIGVTFIFMTGSL